MTNAEFVKTFNGWFDVWVGMSGYDTRPYIEGGDYLPVAYMEGFADGREGHEYPAGDVLAAVSTLPMDTVVIVPEYYGCNYEGEVAFIKTSNGWKEQYTYSIFDERL